MRLGTYRGTLACCCLSCGQAARPAASQRGWLLVRATPTCKGPQSLAAISTKLVCVVVPDDSQSGQLGEEPAVLRLGGLLHRPHLASFLGAVKQHNAEKCSPGSFSKILLLNRPQLFVLPDFGSSPPKSLGSQSFFRFWVSLSHYPLLA